MTVELWVAGRRLGAVQLPAVPQTGDPVVHGGMVRPVRHVIWHTDGEPVVRLILHPVDGDGEPGPG